MRLAGWRCASVAVRSVAPAAGNWLGGEAQLGLLCQLAKFAQHVASDLLRGHLDLFEEVGDVLVVEGQAAAEEGVQNDAAAPDVYLRSRVQLPRNHLPGRGPPRF